MDEAALLKRLQALEQINADRDRKEGLAAFMTAHGNDFSNNEALGNVLYDALAARIGPEDTADAKEAAYKEMVDSLMQDLDSLAKVFKMQLRTLEDTVDEVKSNAEDIQRKINKDSKPEDTAPTPDTPDTGMMPPEGFDMNAEPDYMPEMEAPASGAGMVPPDVGMVPPDMGAAQPAVTVSDSRLKNIKAKLFRSKQ